jgi:hypothetical protein
MRMLVKVMTVVAPALLLQRQADATKDVQD